MLGHYIEVGGFPEPAGDLGAWAAWFEVADRTLAITYRWARHGNTKQRRSRHWRTWRRHGVYVSTVFLSLDHNFGGDGLPVLYETMVFDMAGGRGQRRYTSRAEALRAHAEIVKLLGELLRRHEYKPEPRTT